MLAHLEKNRTLQIFVVKMQTDAEEYMNRLFGNQGFSDYCGDGDFVGREPITAEAIYEFSKNLRFSEMQSK